VTAIKLSSRGGGLSMLVRPSMRAASLEVNQVSGVSGFVLPGDRVDVLVTVDPRTNGQQAITQTILQNIEVLAAGQKTQQQDNKPITVQAVTVLLNPSEAEILALAVHEGEIRLVLRNPEDQEQVKMSDVSTAAMLGLSGPNNPTPPVRRSIVHLSSSPRPVVVNAAPKTPIDKKITYIKSASVSQAPAPTDSTQN